MGLLYVFPVALDEEGFVELKDDYLTLKTYGLPYLFWGYAFAILTVILFMFFAIKTPLMKLASLGDETDALMAYSLLSFIIVLPIILFSFFFFEKTISKRPGRLSLEYRLFGLKFFSEVFHPAESNPYSVEPFLESPNLARMKGGEDSLGFQNKGYHILWLKTADGRRINIDRHSRKADLIKLQELLLLIP